MACEVRLGRAASLRPAARRRKRSVPPWIEGSVSRKRARGTKPHGAGAARAFLGELIDHAPLFPPASLGMDDALAAHERAEGGPHFWMLGRFVVTAARLPELIAALERDDAPGPLPLSVVASDPGKDLPAIAALAREHASRIDIETVEARAPIGALTEAFEAADLPGEPELYVELDPSDPIALESWLLELSRYREASERDACAKVRCGGATADAVPSAASLAHFIALTHGLGVPFKATAGLHHPIRSLRPLTYAADSPRAAMHGYINVFAAAAFAWHGADREHLVKVIAEEDPRAFEFADDELRWRGNRLTTAQVQEARRDFAHSFGSCSFEEPIADLRELGYLS